LLTGEKQTRRSREDAFKTEIMTTTEAYNALDRNRREQVRMLSFHEIAGGVEYTGLAHAALRDLELTPLVQLGRGVLIGRLPAGSAQVVVDGNQPKPVRHETWVRLILPVLQSER